MKNQYFGDVNDYRKYGLLKVLSSNGAVSTGVCWLLTPSDGRSDGQMLRYLEHPEKWRHLDPELFDHLRKSVLEDGDRDVRRMEAIGVLPESSFFPKLLEDNASARQEYVTEMLQNFKGVDLIFFDPDNGFEVQSVPYGRRNANKYLYWREFADSYVAGHSLLVYQHFARISRVSFVQQMASRIQDETGSPNVYAFVTPHVVFLLAPRPEHLTHFHRQAQLVPTLWAGQITLIQPFGQSAVTEPPLENV